MAVADRSDSRTPQWVPFQVRDGLVDGGWRDRAMAG
jgi:hypothetical protein